MDEVYASMQASGGSALVQVTRGSLQRQFDNLRTSIEKDLPSCPPLTATALTTELKYTEMRLEDPSLREDLWATDPATTNRTTMLMTLIQRSKELIQIVTDLPVSEILQLTVITNARICAAVGYIPTAVLALLKLLTSSSSTPNQDQIQSILTTADYPTLVTSLATALETKLQHENGKWMLSATDKEMDVVGSLCSKMRLLARCYPYQVRGVVTVVGNDTTRRDGTSLSTATTTTTDHQLDFSRGEVDGDGEMVSQDWMPDDHNSSMYGDVEGMFNMDDVQWDALLRDFTTGFG